MIGRGQGRHSSRFLHRVVTIASRSGPCSADCRVTARTRPVHDTTVSEPRLGGLLRGSRFYTRGASYHSSREGKSLRQSWAAVSRSPLEPDDNVEARGRR